MDTIGEHCLVPFKDIVDTRALFGSFLRYSGHYRTALCGSFLDIVDTS